MGKIGTQAKDRTEGNANEVSLKISKGLKPPNMRLDQFDYSTIDGSEQNNPKQLFRAQKSDGKDQRRKGDYVMRLVGARNGRWCGNL
ncbi:hypothetical protein [Primorskyibacter sp. S87]|uniref:hypothetical protein n=1 Tax=Primorskyibacter sp. S87 TaxID=3415126 RepID=UPI003C798102